MFYKPNKFWFNWRRLVWPLYKQYLYWSMKPILIGPWRSELGFEALYWIPFLNEFRKQGSAPGLELIDRFIPISRGGGAALYACHRAVELYSLRTPQEVRVQNKIDWTRMQSEKQTHMTAFDKAIYREVAQRLGITKYQTLHPAWMYSCLAPYWDGWKGLQWLSPWLEWSLIGPPPLPEGLTLPPQFVAVRFYFRPTFEPNALVRSAIIATVQRLASQVPVIVLSGGHFADEHQDAAIPSMENVFFLSEMTTVTAENNLRVQAAVLARAALFAGTYGGFSQLAMRMGKPVVAYYDSWNHTCIAHKHLTDVLSVQFGLPYHVYRLREIPWAQSVLPPGVVMEPQGESLDMTRQPEAGHLTESVVA